WSLFFPLLGEDLFDEVLIGTDLDLAGVLDPPWGAAELRNDVLHGDPPELRIVDLDDGLPGQVMRVLADLGRVVDRRRRGLELTEPAEDVVEVVLSNPTGHQCIYLAGVGNSGLGRGEAGIVLELRSL